MGDGEINGFIPADAGATFRPATAAHATWVHPCGCRGNVNPLIDTPGDKGSSLRMQGQLPATDLFPGRCGFIPADAGATAHRGQSCGQAGVHPCGCRGNCVVRRQGSEKKGSSLRMQGQRTLDRVPDVILGFIPADAGATEPSAGSQAWNWVHPCGCRGNITAMQARWPICGSSLRMQGQPAAWDGVAGYFGFIPADAGATACLHSWPWPSRVHPCGCRGNNWTPCSA